MFYKESKAVLMAQYYIIKKNSSTLEAPLSIDRITIQNTGCFI